MTQISSEQSTPVTPVFAGIDVAKDKLDLAVSDGRPLLTADNNQQGIARIVEALKKAPVTRIVVEATGGYERPLVDALLDAGLPVAVVNPSRVRHLAIGLNILAKNDAIDANVLWQFARLAEPRLAVKQSANQVELDALVTCRRQLTSARTAQSNARQTTTSKAARLSIDAVLTTIDRQIEQLDKKIRALIDSDDEFKNLDKLLRSVPGVGPVLSATLVAELTELGLTDRRQIGAGRGRAVRPGLGQLPGQADDPGRTHPGPQRAVHAALAAMRFNPVLKDFAARLRGKGKVAKVVIVACMRKLLTLLNAMVRENLTWDQLSVVKQLTLPAGGQPS